MVVPFFSLLLLGIVQSVVSNAAYFNKPSPPKVIAVVSMQRSGSTSLNTLLSSHPCALNGNEIMTADESQDLLGAHIATGRTQESVRENPVEFLTESHELLCKTNSSSSSSSKCGGDCTIFVKIFDIHVLTQQGEGLESLFRSGDLGFVVLERDVDDSYASLQNALNHKDWLTLPGQKRPEKQVYVATNKYLNRQRRWYSKVRGLLQRFGRTYVEVSFESVQSCSIIHDVLPSIYAFFGMSPRVSIDVSNTTDTILAQMGEFIDSCSE